MDLAKESQFSFRFKLPFQVNNVSLVLSLPGIWMIFHLLQMGISLENNSTPAQFPYFNDTGYLLLVEFMKYRNIFFNFYVGLLIFLAAATIFRRGGIVVKGTPDEQTDKFLPLLVPATVQGLILLTFSYSIALVLLKIFMYFK